MKSCLIFFWAIILAFFIVTIFACHHNDRYNNIAHNCWLKSNILSFNNSEKNLNQLEECNELKKQFNYGS